MEAARRYVSLGAAGPQRAREGVALSRWCGNFKLGLHCFWDSVVYSLLGVCVRSSATCVTLSYLRPVERSSCRAFYEVLALTL